MRSPAGGPVDGLSHLDSAYFKTAKHRGRDTQWALQIHIG